MCSRDICPLPKSFQILYQEAEATFAAEDSTDDSSTLSKMVILAPSAQRWQFPAEPQGASQERVSSAKQIGSFILTIRKLIVVQHDPTRETEIVFRDI